MQYRRLDHRSTTGDYTVSLTSLVGMVMPKWTIAGWDCMESVRKEGAEVASPQRQARTSGRISRPLPLVLACRYGLAGLVSQRANAKS